MENAYQIANLDSWLMKEGFVILVLSIISLSMGAALVLKVIKRLENRVGSNVKMVLFKSMVLVLYAH